MTNFKSLFISLIALAGQTFATAAADTAAVEFRYPDQATISYTSNGEVTQNTTPIAFSSQKAAISEAEAQFLAGTAPKAATSEPVFVEGLAPRAVETGYFVKIGSYTDMDRAIEQTDANPKAQFVSAEVNGTQYFRVFVGPFTSKAQAEATRSDLVAAGNTDAYIVSKT